MVNGILSSQLSALSSQLSALSSQLSALCPLLAEAEVGAGGDSFALQLISVLQWIFVGVGALIVPLAVFYGFKLAYAADEGKRRDVKKRLMNLMASAMIIIFLTGLLFALEAVAISPRPFDDPGQLARPRPPGAGNGPDGPGDGPLNMVCWQTQFPNMQNAPTIEWIARIIQAEGGNREAVATTLWNRQRDGWISLDWLNLNKDQQLRCATAIGMSVAWNGMAAATPPGPRAMELAEMIYRGRKEGDTADIEAVGQGIFGSLWATYNYFLAETTASRCMIQGLALAAVGLENLIPTTYFCTSAFMLRTSDFGGIRAFNRGGLNGAPVMQTATSSGGDFARNVHFRRAGWDSAWLRNPNNRRNGSEQFRFVVTIQGQTTPIRAPTFTALDTADDEDGAILHHHMINLGFSWSNGILLHNGTPIYNGMIRQWVYPGRETGSQQPCGGGCIFVPAPLD